MADFWDNRYQEKEYAYGERPNAFFESQLNKLSPGSIVFPCDGEGRNGVYAGTRGWKVFAFDLSEAGKNKALGLAARQNISIDYKIEDAVNAG